LKHHPDLARAARRFSCHQTGQVGAVQLDEPDVGSTSRLITAQKRAFARPDDPMMDTDAFTLNGEVKILEDRIARAVAL